MAIDHLRAGRRRGGRAVFAANFHRVARGDGIEAVAGLLRGLDLDRVKIEGAIPGQDQLGAIVGRRRRGHGGGDGTGGFIRGRLAGRAAGGGGCRSWTGRLPAASGGAGWWAPTPASLRISAAASTALRPGRVMGFMASARGALRGRWASATALPAGRASRSVPGMAKSI